MRRTRNRFREFLHAYHWLVLGLGWLIALALGFIGFAKNLQANKEPFGALDIAYRILQLIPMNSGAVIGEVGWELNVARFAIPALAAYTALQAFAIFFREQMQSIRLHFLRDHIIIAGLSRKGFLLARGFRERGDSVVAIEQNKENTHSEPCREHGCLVLIGDARDATTLRKAGVLTARCLIAVCDDGTNAEIAMRAEGLSYQRQRNPLTTIIHLANPQLCELLREREIAVSASKFHLELFNIFDRGARLLLQQFPARRDTATKCAPHLLIVGLGRMGESLVIHAARTWRDENPSCEQRLRISVIDREANTKTESLRARYPKLERACDLTPLQMELHSPDFQRAAFLYDTQHRRDVTAVYVSLEDATLGLFAGLTLMQQTRHCKIPVVVRMVEETGLATLLGKGQDAREHFGNLFAFGLLDRTCTPELLLGGTHEILARTLHEEYVRQQTDLGSNAQLNPALVPWDKLAEQWKESNCRQAEHIGIKLKKLGYGIAPLTDWDAASFAFTQEEVETMARMEHERWCEDLRQKGWRHTLSEKNVVKQTHPDLVSWESLPESEKDKNRNAARELPRFLARAGFQVYRSK